MTQDTCICIDLRSAAQQLTKIYDEAMAEAGISVNQFSLMHLIITLKGPTMKELAAASGLDRSTLGRNLRVMEKQHLVELVVGNDARARNIQMTTEGLTAFKTAVPLWQTVQNNMIDRLGTDRRADLRVMLEQLTAPTPQLEETIA